MMSISLYRTWPPNFKIPQVLSGLHERAVPHESQAEFAGWRYVWL